MKTPLKVLIAAESKDYVQQIGQELESFGAYHTIHHVKDELAYIEAINDFVPDAIFCEYGSPLWDGLAAFKIREAVASDTPFILLIGTEGEAYVADLIKDGVTDFVLTDKMFTLHPKMLRALEDQKERVEKRKTQKELKQSEARLVQAQAIAKIGSWETNLVDLKVNWSEETYKIFEIDRHSFYPTHAAFLEFIHPEDREAINLAFEQSLRGPTVNSIQHRIITAAGHLKHIEECWHVVTDEHGKPSQATGTCQDITERKKTEAAIDKANLEKNLVLESIGDGFFATDSNSMVTYWNKQASLLLGMSKEEILGKNLHHVFADSNSPVFYDHYQKALREKTAVRFEGFSERSLKWFEVNAFGSDTGLSVYFKDVTEKKQADAQLKESELRYRSLIEHASDAICIVDTQLRFIEVNTAACQQSGYTREEILQCSVPDLLFKEELATNPLKIPTLSPGKTFLYERMLKKKDGTALEMELSGKMMDDGRVMIFIRDISERKRAAQLISESEAKYRAFFDNGMDGILLAFTDGEILAANPAACHMFQMTEAEICAAGRMGIVDPTDARVLAVIKERQLTGRASGEITFVRKDGSSFPGEISSMLFEDNLGMEKTSIAIRDISARKADEWKLLQTAGELQKTLKDLRNIMDFSMDVICTINQEGKFVQLNAASYQTWGYHPGELINTKYINLVHAEDVEKTLDISQKIQGGIEGTMFENCYLHKAGKTVHMLWSAIWDDQDKLMYCIGKDVTETKRLEKANEIERQRFLGLYLQAPSCMGILKGPDHVYEMANPLYLQLIGKKDIIGKTIKEVLPELESQGIFKFLDSVYTTGNSFSANEMLVQIDIKGTGELVDTYLNFIYQAHRNGEGEIDGIFFFAIDVTEQVLSRLKIEESSKRYRQIVETAQEGIWMVDENNRTSFVNKKMCEILGYTEEEMMGKEIYAFMDEAGKKIAAELMALKKNGDKGQAHFKYISKTGTEVWTNVSANSLYDEKGLYKGSLAMVTDITQSKKAEKRDQFQATLLNTIGQSTIATDMQGKIIFWNKAASLIYGWTEEETLGKNIIEITPAEQTKEHAEEVMQQLILGNNWSGEWRVKRKDGTEFTAYVTNAPIKDKQGQLIGIIGVSYDITDQKLAELELKESNDRYRRSEMKLQELNADLKLHARELATSNMELEQFAYVASHDLQEPLRMISSFLLLLQKKYETLLDDKAIQYIGFAVDGANRMRQIILDLLEFSRVGRTEDKLEALDLNELVEEVKILCRKQIVEKNATIVSDKLPSIAGYKAPLRQVFQNLISNSLKYSGNEVATSIQITCKELPDHWQFGVKDNGVGIEAEYFDKIFVIFQRLHTNSEFSGTGMGLAISKKIVENQGGKMWVESEVGKGSTFYFTLLKNKQDG